MANLAIGKVPFTIGLPLRHWKADMPIHGNVP